MSTALYRRYRPEDFSQVIGQDQVTVPLMNALRNNKTNHAYLFSGPRGCGKTTSARILARCLNCAEGPTDTPCGTCESCIELSRSGSGSLDVIEIDAASHGGVDDARDLRERATFAPARDRYKIFIIDEAHMVTSAGFNALLKIVEEPPEHIKFIFATTEPDKVIETIRSRTHHYPFRLVPPTILHQYLEHICAEEGLRVEPGVLSIVVRAGGGSVRDSLSILDQLMNGSIDNTISYNTAVDLLGYTHATLLNQVLDGLSSQNPEETFKAIDQIIQTGHDPQRFIEDLLERLRDLIVLKAAPESASSLLPAVPEDQREVMQQQASHFGLAQLTYTAEQTALALNEMSGATSPRLHLELLCAKLLLPRTSQGDLAFESRMERLEQRVIGQASETIPASIAPKNVQTAKTTQVASPPLTPKPAAIENPQVTEPPVEEDYPPHEPEEIEMPARNEPPVPQEDPSVITPKETKAENAPEATITTEQVVPVDASTLRELRQRWEEITEALKYIKRTSWSLINKNTQVEHVNGQEIKVSFPTEGMANTFNRNRQHPENLAIAIKQILGADYIVTTVPRQETGVVPPVQVQAAKKPVTQIDNRAEVATEPPRLDGHREEPQKQSLEEPTQAPQLQDETTSKEITPEQPQASASTKPKKTIKAASQSFETEKIPSTSAVKVATSTRPDPLKKPWIPAKEDPNFSDSALDTQATKSTSSPAPTEEDVLQEDYEDITNKEHATTNKLTGADLLAEKLGATLIEEIPKEQ
ncbi:MAG: DNA polymerase III subunit gamma and tau [Micrococcaceae bacterium]